MNGLSVGGNVAVKLSVLLSRFTTPMKYLNIGIKEQYHVAVLYDSLLEHPVTVLHDSHFEGLNHIYMYNVMILIFNFLKKKSTSDLGQAVRNQYTVLLCFCDLERILLVT